MGNDSGTRLTPRELEVLRLVARGYTNRQISAELCITPGTVGRHLENISVKLDTHGRMMLVLAVLCRGWLTLNDIARDTMCKSAH